MQALQNFNKAVELELELIQTHLAQKPLLWVEVGACGAQQVKVWWGGMGRRGCRVARMVRFDFTSFFVYNTVIRSNI